MRYLTVRQVADRLGYKDVDSVYSKIRARLLRATRIPGTQRWRVSEADLEYFMADPVVRRDDAYERAKAIASARVSERIRRGELPDPRGHRREVGTT
jgi:excisionase family DNA binding protein